MARRRLTGRSGPARDAREVYRVAAREHLASVPPRDYRGLAMLLAEAVEAPVQRRRSRRPLGASRPTPANRWWFSPSGVIGRTGMGG